MLHRRLARPSETARKIRLHPDCTSGQHGTPHHARVDVAREIAPAVHRTHTRIARATERCELSKLGREEYFLSDGRGVWKEVGERTKAIARRSWSAEEMVRGGGCADEREGKKRGRGQFARTQGGVSARRRHSARRPRAICPAAIARDGTASGSMTARARPRRGTPRHNRRPASVGARELEPVRCRTRATRRRGRRRRGRSDLRSTTRRAVAA